MRTQYLLRHVKLLLLIIPVMFHSASAQSLQDLEFLTETYPPYNFESDGILKGISVDLLISASHKAGSPIMRKNIKLKPWARAYRSALEASNVTLFSTTRTKGREQLFKWAGPIAQTKIVILAKKSSSITINNADDLKLYTLGAIRDDVGEQLLRGLSVPTENIRLSSNANSLVKKLDVGRIQLWAYEENVARWFIKNNGLDNYDFEVVYTLKVGELYFAFSKEVDDAVVSQFQKGLDEVKTVPGKIGKTLYDDILSNYL